MPTAPASFAPTSTAAEVGSFEDQDNKGERYHAGRAKWGKYKEKEAKKRVGKGKEVQQKVQETSGGKDQFAFPDGGWVCADCQNYNFAGRAQCNRCKKRKTSQD